MYQNKISALLAEQHIEIPAEKWDAALTDFGLDSLQLALFILALEQKFKINISLQTIDLKYFHSITQINKLIEEQLSL